jgi:hypothetical protein
MSQVRFSYGVELPGIEPDTTNPRNGSDLRKYIRDIHWEAFARTGKNSVSVDVVHRSFLSWTLFGYRAA